MLMNPARVYARSLLEFGLKFIGYMPSQLVRKNALRLSGAKLSLGVLVHHGFWVQSPSNLAVGSNSVIGDHAILDARGGLRIGSRVCLSSWVAIWTGQHDWQSIDFAYDAAPVSIGDYAWLSFRSVILPGVCVGEGAVVAAGAVVTKDVPPYSLVAGVPAKVIGERPRNLRYPLGYGDRNFTRFL